MLPLKQRKLWNPLDQLALSAPDVHSPHSHSQPNLRFSADARRRKVIPMQSSPEVKVGPRHYFESVDDKPRGEHATRQPVCVYLETTNRCNLLCTTCPRTYAELEPPADMSWKLFTSIVDQIPNLQ